MMYANFLALAAISLLVGHTGGADSDLVDDEIKYYKPGITADEILRARGYTAKVHHFITEDNYQLEIVQGNNPLLANRASSSGRKKLPILFIHGIIMTNGCWLLNSGATEPRLYEQDIDFDSISEEEFYEIVKDDPARKSLPLLAMNLGYEVWILSRRGFTAGSRRKVNRAARTLVDAILDVPPAFLSGGFSFSAGLEPGRARDIVPISQFNTTHYDSTTLDKVRPDSYHLANLLSLPETNIFQAVKTLGKLPSVLANLGDIKQQFIDTFDTDFWNFSIDEQAANDFPATINFVLEKTGLPKLHLVSYSSGGAMSLLGLSLKPELADKISRHVCYQPAINLGSKQSLDYLNSLVVPLTQSYVGPLPFLFQINPLIAFLQQLCSYNLAQKTYCEAVVDSIVGYSAGQEPINPYFFAVTPAATGSHELIQLGQFTRTEVPCMFNFSTAEQNYAKYGQRYPPCYDLGRITLRNMSIWAGQDDRLVAANSVATSVKQLKVPVEFNLVGDKKVHYNHLGNEIHVNNDKLVLLPSMISIARSNSVDAPGS